MVDGKPAQAVVFHSIWANGSGRLLLWAEQPIPARKSRASSAARRPHPFAVPGEALAESLRLSAALRETVTLTLPTVSGRPVPSPELRRKTGALDPDAEVALVEWKVPVLALPPGEALEWLGRVPSPEAAEGADLRYWRLAGRFVLDLLRRERWLPTLAQEPDGASSARWLPMLNLPEDASRFRTLEGAFPDAARALVDGTGQRSRGGVLRGFLNATVDHAVRAWTPHSPAPDGTAAGAWLSALTSGNPRLNERPENLRALRASLQQWSEPIRAAGTSGFRTCFRIDPPVMEGTDEAPWHLGFWLQATDEPSLLVPAEEVWERGSGGLTALGRRWEAPQEQLLPALVRAGRLFNPILEALNSRAPTGTELNTGEAYQFLREVAPLLEETGAGVVAPDWWRKPGARLGLRVKMRSSGTSSAPGVLTKERLIEFDWQLAIGGEPLTAEEFKQLASLKTPLVRLRGKWLELHPGEVERAIRAWERRKLAGPLSLLDALSLPEDGEGLPIDVVEAEGDLEKILQGLRGERRPDPVPVPESFHGLLRPYQQAGLEWLTFLRECGLGACLADDMGLGKTIQVLAYLLNARKDDGLPPTLLVCPTSLVENWRREAAKFAPSLRVYIHHGASRVRNVAAAAEETPPEVDDDSPADFAAAVAGYDLVVTTYALAMRDQEALRTVTWDSVILDEAQNVKNPETRQSRAIRTLPAATRVAMTGTPVENRLTDLWSLMEFLNPGFLGSERNFRGKFAVPIERDRDPEASERLRRLVHPFLLRRVKTDPTVIQDLPEKQEMKVACTLTSEQATLYEAIVKEMIEQIEGSEGIQRKGLVLATLGRLKQVCNHPAQLLRDGSALPGRSGKLERLVEMLDEILTMGEAALVFSQFAEMGELLQQHLAAVTGREILFLHGGVPRAKRDEMVERFRAPEGPPIMVLSLKAGGVGLNLTRANHVFHFDRWWNPAVENQATDRAFRIGQTRQVQVHKFLCAGTLEDRIDEMIEQKQGLAQSIVGTGEGWLTELSTAAFRDLITLRKDALR